MRGFRSSSPRRVGDLLAAAVPGLSEHLLEASIRREWSQVVPAALARRSEPGQLMHGTLEVKVDNSPWLQELSMRSPEILAALAARYGGAVRSVRVSLGAVRPAVTDPAPPGSKAASRPSAPRLSAEDVREVGALADTLPDPDLARAMRRLLTKDRLARRSGSVPRGRETET